MRTSENGIWLTSERILRLRFVWPGRWTRKDFRRSGLGKQPRRFALAPIGRAKMRTDSGKRRSGCCGMMSFCSCGLKRGTEASLFLLMRNPRGDETGFGIATFAKCSFSRPARLRAVTRKLKWRQMDSGLISTSLQEKSAICRADCAGA